MREGFKERFEGVQERNQAGKKDHEGLEGVRKEWKEFETYSNRKVEKGFTSPLR